MRGSIIIALVFAISGCTGAGQIAPEERKIRNVAIIHHEFKKVWASAVEWFAINNIPIDKIQKDDGLITSERHLGASKELDCGRATGQISWAAANMENVNGNINVVLKKEDESSTEVIVAVFGKAMVTIRNGFGAVISASQAHCVSTGVIEKSLIQYLENI